MEKLSEVKQALKYLEIDAKAYADNFSASMIVSTKNILAIAEAFRALDQEVQKNLDGALAWQQRAEAAEAKLAELERQEPIYQYMTVSMSDETWLQERWHDCTKEEFDDANSELGPTRRVYRQQQPCIAHGLHSSTAELVITFAEALARKLLRSQEKYGWHDGWKDAAWQEKCLSDFHHHIGKGDPLDVAAYCAFMLHHGWKTRPAPAADLVPIGRVDRGEVSDNNEYPNARVVCLHDQADWENFPDGTKLFLRPAPAVGMDKPEPYAWLVHAPQGDYVERNPEVVAHLEGTGLTKCKPLYLDL